MSEIDIETGFSLSDLVDVPVQAAKDALGIPSASATAPVSEPVRQIASAPRIPLRRAIDSVKLPGPVISRLGRVKPGAPGDVRTPCEMYEDALRRKSVAAPALRVKCEQYRAAQAAQTERSEAPLAAEPPVEDEAAKKKKMLMIGGGVLLAGGLVYWFMTRK